MDIQLNDTSSLDIPTPSQSDTSEEEKRRRRRRRIRFLRGNASSDNPFLGDKSQENPTSPTSNSDVDPGLPRSDYLDFEKCLLCKTEKKNISYPYCRPCFSLRKDLFPVRKRQSRRSKDASCNGILKDGAAANAKAPEPKDAANSSSENTAELCRVCFLRPENGIFIHTKISHRYGCYNCAKRIWGEIKCCPICRRKVPKVLPLFS